MRIELDEQCQKLVGICRQRVSESKAYHDGVEDGVNSVLNRFLFDLVKDHKGNFQISADGKSLEDSVEKEPPAGKDNDSKANK
jgi:hypothetical protein